MRGVGGFAASCGGGGACITGAITIGITITAIIITTIEDE
jgi:hypothetical protein